MQTPVTPESAARIRTPATKALLLAAAVMSLAGCASSDRMMRVSPMSEPSESSTSVSKVGARDAHQTLREDRVNAFPLVYLNGAMHSVLWPFIDWDDQGLAVRPFYNREGENQSVLFPFTGWDDNSGWAFNTVWKDNKGWLFLPLAGSWGDTTFVGPAHWSDDGSNGVFPLWNSEPNSIWLAELYASSWGQAGYINRRSLCGALYLQEESPNGDGSLWILPVGYFEKDGANHLAATPLYSAGVYGDSSWMNIHPLWWSGSGNRGGNYSMLLPIWYRSQDKSSGTDFYTPLGGVSRDASGEINTVNALGFAYHWSHEKSHDYRHVLWPLYADIETHKSGYAPNDAFALVTRKSGGGVDAFRITPLFSTETGEHDERREWCHLLSFHTVGGNSGFAVTPLFAHATGENFTDTRLFPIYRDTVADGETTRFTVTPFYAQDADPYFCDYLTHLVVVSDQPDDRETRVALLFKNSERKFHPDGEGMVSRDKKSGFSYTHETTVSRKFRPEMATDTDIRTLVNWLRYGQYRRIAGKGVTADSGYDENNFGEGLTSSDAQDVIRKENAGIVDEILVRRGIAPKGWTDAARLKACRQLLATATRETTATRFAIDPFFIPLFDSHSAETTNDWSLLFGFARSETQGERTKTSVLRYLYNRESGPDGSRLNCFPFVQYDESEEATSFGFLWRVFDRKKDLKTGETKGHILFIPY